MNILRFQNTAPDCQYFRKGNKTFTQLMYSANKCDRPLEQVLWTETLRSQSFVIKVAGEVKKRISTIILLKWKHLGLKPLCVSSKPTVGVNLKTT